MALPILETATYELTLPSANVVVKYRPFLVKEEKVLLQALESNDDVEIKWYVGDIRPNIHRYRKDDIEYLAHKQVMKAGEIFQMKTDVIHEIVNATDKIGVTIYD